MSRSPHWKRPLSSYSQRNVCHPPLAPFSAVNQCCHDFSARWSIDDLIKQIGTSVNRVTARKALLTWVEHGVLTEVEEHGVYRLLEVAEERQEGATTTMLTDDPDDAAAAGSNEQAEQMRMYWKVCFACISSCACVHSHLACAVHRRYATELANFTSRSYTGYAQAVRAWV